MRLDEYIAHRKSLFYAKADEPVIVSLLPRHTIETRGPHIYRHSNSPIQPDYSMHAEQAAIQEAWTAGLPVLRCTTHFNAVSTYQVMGRAMGGTLADVTSDLVRKVAFNELAHILARLHSIPVGGFGLLAPSVGTTATGLMGTHQRWHDYVNLRLAEHLFYLASADLITSEVGVVIREVFQQFPLHDNVPFKTSLLHGDLNSANVFVDSQGLITNVIDFEDALGGDPIYDLAFWATFHDEKWHREVVVPYYATSLAGKPRNFDVRFWTYYLRVSVMKLVLLHKQGHTDLTRGKARITLALERLKTL